MNKKRLEVVSAYRRIGLCLESNRCFFSNMSSTMPIENPSPRLDKVVSSCSDAIQSHDQTIRIKLETAQTGLQLPKMTSQKKCLSSKFHKWKRYDKHFFLKTYAWNSTITFFLYGIVWLSFFFVGGQIGWSKFLDLVIYQLFFRLSWKEHRKILKNYFPITFLKC